MKASPYWCKFCGWGSDKDVTICSLCLDAKPDPEVFHDWEIECIRDWEFTAHGSFYKVRRFGINRRRRKPGWLLDDESRLFIVCPNLHCRKLLRSTNQVDEDGEINIDKCVTCSDCGLHIFAILEKWAKDDDFRPSTHVVKVRTR